MNGGEERDKLMRFIGGQEEKTERIEKTLDDRKEWNLELQHRIAALENMGVQVKIMWGFISAIITAVVLSFIVGG